MKVKVATLEAAASPYTARGESEFGCVAATGLWRCSSRQQSTRTNVLSGLNSELKKR